MSQLIENYLYLYQLDEYLIIPEYPDSVSDSLQSTFQQVNALSRTAPVFAYSYSGPRQVNVQIHLHRDMLNDVNIDKSNLKLEVGEDYVDALIRKLQASVLPRYNAANNSIVPPMVALRFGNEIFIKGVINGNISLEYIKPILDNDKYAQVTIAFNVFEIDPYDAESVSQEGSFRGLTRQFKEGIRSDANKMHIGAYRGVKG